MKRYKEISFFTPKIWKIDQNPLTLQPQTAKVAGLVAQLVRATDS